MDHHVLQDYFVQVGRSYYQSPEFRQRQLAVDATGEFGIGILSVFMVADSLEVESRMRPDDPLHPPMPVKCSVRSAFDYFVERPSARNEIGTRLELHLKQGHPFGGNLPDVVARMAPFVEIPIEVETDSGRSVVGPGTHKPPPELFECRFQVPLESSLEKAVEGMTGYISVGGVPQNRSGVVAQNGFAIGHRENPYERIGVDALFPEWTSVFVSLDLRGSAKLSLRPDRSDLVEDERSEMLRAAIGRLTARKLREHLEERRLHLVPADYSAYINELLEENSLTAQSYHGFRLPEAVRDIFLDWVPLSAVGPDGEPTVLYGRQLLGLQRLGFIGVADCSAREKLAQVFSELRTAFGESVALLRQGGKGHFSRSQFVEHLFGHPTEYMVSAVPGVIVDILIVGAERTSYAIGGKVEVARRVYPHNGHAPLLWHQASPSFLQSVVFNPNHPALAPFVRGSEATSAQAKDLLCTFDDSVEEILREIQASFPPSVWIGSKWGIYQMHEHEAINMLLGGVLVSQPQRLGQFQEAICRLWSRAQQCGLIEASACVPKLGLEDFPWFWSIAPGD